MADKEFTQICKEILGIGKRLEKIEPDELREIKTSIERLSEAFNANKALFDESKSDFDGKYNKVAQIVVTFDALKPQIEEVLRSGVIDDNVEGLISTFSSKKIMDLLNEAKGVVNENFSTIYKNGINPWSSTLDYPAGAISALNGKLYQAKIQNTNKNPANEATIWDIVATQEWSENQFLKKSDDKFAQKINLPTLATETKAGITKLKNAITAKQEDVTVTEKAVSDAIDINKSIGIGQTYQDVWNQRELNIYYPNTTGRPIEVNFNLETTTGSYIFHIIVDDVIIKKIQSESLYFLSTSFIVPAGSKYKITIPANTGLKKMQICNNDPISSSWTELR